MSSVEQNSTEIQEVPVAEETIPESDSLKCDNGDRPVGEDSVNELKLDRVQNESFKKPQLLVGPQRGKAAKNSSSPKLYKIAKDILKTGDVSSYSENTKLSSQLETNKLSKHIIHSEPLENKDCDEPQSKTLPPLLYKEPEWSGFSECQYKLEELKNGTIVKSIDLTDKKYFVFGRLESCDIPMLHPSVSRYHAVLQYRSAGDGEHEPGFYIYDLGSTSGTTLNKQKLKPKTYIRVRVGHILKLAFSTRLFVLQGPSEDEEPESELSVTELKQQYRQRLANLEAEKARKEMEEEEKLKKEEEKGINWGMGEDADEETDLTENPYAVTQNEELYLDDPKKTLRGWFDREGEELEYQVEEKNFGHFVCRIELPVEDGSGVNMVAEASLKGKKKEVVFQAALEACRLLDRQGLLRQANQESRKRVIKDWEANDYYDSDEDNFLDRTGQIEKKRQKRMAQLGKLEQTVETYETSVKKYSEIVKELEVAENKLNKMLKLATQVDRNEEEDELDAYMNTLDQSPSDKIEIKKFKNEVARLRSEEVRLSRLVNLTKPTELPSIEPRVIKPPLENTTSTHTGVKIGKISTKKRRPQLETALPQQTTQQLPSSETQEEEEEEDDNDDNIGKQENESVKTEQKMEAKKRRSRPDTRDRSKKRQVPISQLGDGEDYSTLTWTPPVGQTGDGRTSLNEKLGY